jgi:MFS family permease
MAEASRTHITYRYERWRAVASGVLETATSTFLLVIALQWFHAGAFAKAMVAGGGSLGLIVSPVIVTVVSSLGWPTATAAARLLAVGAFSFLLAAALPGLPIFILGSVAGMATSAAVIPLLTQMYQENYPAKERGRLFSKTVMIRIGTAALFSKLAGGALDGRLDQFRWLLLVFAMALGGASYCLARCPSQALTAEGGGHPFRAMRFVREDPLFRRTLICWMLMGFANLMMLPLRVEYLGNPNYHFGLSVTRIAILTGVIPNLARLVMSPVWGWCFDHLNFFALRVTLNIGFALGMLAFFGGHSLTGMVLGAIIFGISNAGGDVAWSLWVTKFAPAARVADYMSVHTFFTGVRGVLAPICGFYFISRWPVGWLAIISSAMIIAASLLLVPEIRFGRRARAGTALVEEVSD